MDQYDECLMFTLSDPPIQSHTVDPAGDVCPWDPASEHPFKVHNEVECDPVDVVTISKDHVLTPSDRL